MEDEFKINIQGMHATRARTRANPLIDNIFEN
jgi:hypothetical protein